MKLTSSQLREIIKEEIEKLTTEARSSVVKQRSPLDRRLATAAVGNVLRSAGIEDTVAVADVVTKIIDDFEVRPVYAVDRQRRIVVSDVDSVLKYIAYVLFSAGLADDDGSFFLAEKIYDKLYYSRPWQDLQKRKK